MVELLEAEGAEAVMPDLLDFLMYSFYNSNYKYEFLGKSKKSMIISNAGISLLEKLRKPMTDALKRSKRFEPPTPIKLSLIMPVLSFP